MRYPSVVSVQILTKIRRLSIGCVLVTLPSVLILDVSTRNSSTDKVLADRLGTYVWPRYILKPH